MVAEPQIVEMLESFEDEGEGDDSDFNHNEAQTHLSYVTEKTLFPLKK